MKKYFQIAILIVITFQGILYSQSNSVIDSLEHALSNSKNLKDSASTLCWLTWRSGDLNPELAYKYGMKTLELSKKVKDEILLAEVFDATALGFRCKGNKEKAKEYYNKALELGYKLNSLHRIAWENNSLANISLEDGNLGDAFNYGTESRKAFKILNNLRMVITNDLILIRTNHKAYVDTALNDAKYALNITNDPNDLLNLHLNLVFLYGEKENRTQSMKYAMRALEIAEGINNQRAIIKVCYQIAEYLRDYQHNYDVALLYYQKILKICEKDNSGGEIVGPLEEIGIVYQQLGNDSLAAVYFNRCLKIAQKINHLHSIANAYKNIGSVYYSKKNYSEAVNYFTKCFETGCDQCKPLAFHLVLVNIGNSYLNLYDYPNALKYYNKSLQLAGVSDADQEKAVSYLALANYYQLMNSPELSLKYLNISFSKAISASSLSLQKEIALKLNKIYSERKDFKNAYKYLAIYNTLNDSLNKISAAENLSKLETKFEFQNLNAQKEAEINKQTQQKYFFIIAFILTSILGLVIYKSFHRKIKDSRLLELQKKQIEDMSEQVHEADQKKLNFFTNISHEFRTPLTLILGPVEKLIRDSKEDKKSLSMLNLVHRNTLHLYNLINQLLDIRKLDTGNINLSVVKDDIIIFCKGIFSSFSHLADENKIKYTFNTGLEKLTGWFDKDIIEKILNNLISNAFKYTPKGREINLSLFPVINEEKVITHIKITVCDNGNGIPDDQIQYVFDRYYQVENTNTGFNTGTGIGLAYTKELVELHKGEISVDSKLGVGTTFTIILPIEDSHYSKEEISNIEKLEKEEDPENIGQKYLEEIIAVESELIENPELRIEDEESKIMLLIEDNADLRAFIKNIFSNDFKVIEASEGESGFRMACELIPDIIISDIMMPGINGLELSHKLKSNIHTNHIPILILTAKTGNDNEMEGLRTGADDYVTKPFNSEILSLRVSRLIESKKKLGEYFKREFLLNPKEIKLISPDDEFLRKAVKTVEDNITNPDLNIEMLANQLAVSKMQLFRKLKALTNCSGNQFIRNIKLKRAAQLLQQNSLNITEVLYESGFNSPSYFSTCFKEMYGCLPKEYSSKYKKDALLTNS